MGFLLLLKMKKSLILLYQTYVFNMCVNNNIDTLVEDKNLILLKRILI